MVETLEIEPQAPASSTVIWLHGLGANGHDFEPLVRDWRLVEELGVRFVLPHAPLRPVSMNNGHVMRAWYDIYELGFRLGEDEAGIEKGREQLLELVAREEARGIPTQRIVLAGFSQGGALALHTALRMQEPLAGVLALSTYLPLPDRLADEKRPDPDALTIRMDHGQQDDVVPIRWSETCCELVRAEGFQVEFKSWPMGHSLCPGQTRSLRAWLADRLGARI